MDIGLLGTTGRMGRSIITEIINDEYFKLKSGYVRDDSNFSDFDLGEIAGKYPINIKATSNLQDVISSVDAVIDFSSPSLSIKALKLAASYQKIFISGTTGYSEAEFLEFNKLAKTTRTVWSSNMSIGINLLNHLIEQTTKMLNDDYDTEVLEMHHRNKKDSPSGTALTLGKTIADAKNLNFNEIAVRSREGISEKSRGQNEIGFATLRGGSVIGDHSVIFASDNDTITLSHHAQNRNIFAKGALAAAKWAESQENGLYSMRDVIKTRTNF